MHKLKAYTLLEITIVIIILILIISTLNFFIPDRNDKQLKFGKKCATYIYQEIQNEINDIKKNKSKTINGSTYYHIQSSFFFVDNDNIGGSNTIKIESKLYSGQINNHIKKNNTIIDEGSCLNTDIKNTDKYKIYLQTGANIKIFKGGVIDTLTNNSNNIIQINTCTDTTNISTCIPISKIIFDKAAQIVMHKLCLDFSGSSCNKWEK